MGLYIVYRVRTDARRGCKRVWSGPADNEADAVRIAVSALNTNERRGLFAKPATMGDPRDHGFFA